VVTQLAQHSMQSMLTSCCKPSPGLRTSSEDGDRAAQALASQHLEWHVVRVILAARAACMCSWRHEPAAGQAACLAARS
jgi:hypothetical protein